MLEFPGPEFHTSRFLISKSSFPWTLRITASGSNNEVQHSKHEGQLGSHEDHGRGGRCMDHRHGDLAPAVPGDHRLKKQQVGLHHLSASASGGKKTM